MSFITVALSAGTLFGLAVILTYVLGWANKAFHVETDPRVEAINEVLPGANCGGCGYIGCGEYAEAVAAGQEDVTKCIVGGGSVTEEVAEIMGVEVGASLPYRAVVHCGANYPDRLQRHEYRGEKTCAAANLVAGVQGCTYGCLGFGDCTRACNFDAIHVIDGLATVDYVKCVGCGACGNVCPRNIITITPFKSERILVVDCSNKDTGKEVMAVCKVGCIGCGACARLSDLFSLTDGLSTIDYDKYEPECSLEVLKACDKCPRNRLVFIGKPTPAEAAAAEELEAPDVVEPEFKTTVDETEWRG